MPRMSLNEADTRAKLITPALHSRGWTEDLIRREERAAPIDIADDRAWRRNFYSLGHLFYAIGEISGKT